MTKNKYAAAPVVCRPRSTERIECRQRPKSKPPVRPRMPRRIPHPCTQERPPKRQADSHSKLCPHPPTSLHIGSQSPEPLPPWNTTPRPDTHCPRDQPWPRPAVTTQDGSPHSRASV